MVQQLLAYAIVVLAGSYCAWRGWRALSSRRQGCGGCGKCSGSTSHQVISIGVKPNNR